MNMLERFLGHDLDSSRELLELCLTLSDEQLDRRIDAGWGTLRLTFEHMIANIEVWSDLMQERPLRTAPRPNSTLDLLFRAGGGLQRFRRFCPAGRARRPPGSPVHGRAGPPAATKDAGRRHRPPGDPQHAPPRRDPAHAAPPRGRPERTRRRPDGLGPAPAGGRTWLR